jgi:hypothetical protein
MSDNDLRLDEQIRRAKAAKDLLDHPLFIEAMTAIRGDSYKRFADSGFKDRELRDEIWREQQTIDKLERKLKEVITTGRLAQETLLQKTKKRLKLA